MTVVVVGASVAGIRTAQALRMQGYDGAVTIIGAEVHLPYDKPPLSKEVLTGETPGALISEEQLAALSVDLRLGVRATSLDPEARVVETSDGRSVAYTTLVIATGMTPRMLPGIEPPPGVHTMRTVDDALALREVLLHGATVVVIGAGFIGAEFASAARRHGCAVSIVEPQPTPMAHLLGEAVGAALAQLHTQNGVSLHTGVTFDRFETTSDGHVQAVVLGDGQRLPAGVVVVGIGATPATAWLESSGLPLSDGVECDDQLRVRGYPDIFAAGDVARWPHALYGHSLRIEHWSNANEHAAIVAAGVLGKPVPAPQVPYVWSDQYGHRIQIIGRPAIGQLVSMTGTAEDHLTAVYADGDGSVVGAVVVDDPRKMLQFRKAIMKHAPASDLVPADAGPVPR